MTIPYGSKKRGNKLHPHDKCEACGESNICKKTARREAKEEIKKELEEVGDERR